MPTVPGIGLALGAGVVLGLVCGVACSPSAFACEESSDCADGAALGTCEPNGWCSFPDADCDSGARYGVHSGDGLAGACVTVDATTSSGEVGTTLGDPTLTGQDGTSPLDTSSAGETSPVDSSSGSPTDPTGDSVCGDGALGTDEACDDGNQVDADGCSAQCLLSGSIVWSVALGDGLGWGHSLDAFADGGTAVGIVSEKRGEAAQSEVWRLDSAGVPGWSWASGPVGDYSQSTWGLDVENVDGLELIAVAMEGQDADGSQGLTATLDDQGALLWSTAQAHVRYFGASMEPTGEVIVVGHTDDDAGATVAYDSAGGELGLITGEPFAPADGFAFDVVADGDVVYTTGLFGEAGHESAFFNAATNNLAVRSVFMPAAYNEGLALALDPASTRRWVVGFASEQGGWVATVTPRGIELEPTIVTDVFPANLHGVAVAPDGSALVVGWDAALGTRDSFVARIAPDGQRVWTASFETSGGDDDLRDVVVHPDGTVVVVGTRLGDDGTPAAWVAQLVP